MSVRYHLISPAEIDGSLLETWRSIQSNSGDYASPCFCPEFARLVAGVRDDARVLVIENSNRPVAFFPHQRSLLGLGKPVAGPLSDFHGVVSARDCEWKIDALMRAAGLAVFAFDHLVDTTRRFAPYIATSAESPQIDLSSGYESYVKDRRSATDYIPKTEGLARKCARELGELTFTLHDADPDALNLLFKWKSEQYKRSMIVDGFGVPWTRELLTRISAFQTAEFSGVCSSLRAGGRIVAVHMGMRSRDVMHYWFPAYEPEFAKFSVGIILLLRLASAVAGLGVRTIDLGKGNAQYKQRLMTGAVCVHEGFVGSPSLLATAWKFRRQAEVQAAQGGIGSILNLPLRAIRRLERNRKFH